MAAATGVTAAPPASSMRPVLRPADFGRHGVATAEAIIARARLGGHVAYAVADAFTGEVLEQSTPVKGLPPASVAKAVTAVYALDVLGPSHRFKTDLCATGPIENGVLKGDLILKGGGDPTLNTIDLAGLVTGLKASGVVQVAGTFIVDDSAFRFVKTIDAGQPDHLGYSPAVAGIALNFNRVHFEWRRSDAGYRVSMQARSEGLRPDVSMAAMQVVERNAPVYAYREALTKDQWSVARRALGKSGGRWLPVRKPGLYAGDVFRILAEAEGIKIGVPAVRKGPAKTRVLARHESAALADIARDMLKYSTNLTAEMIGLAASVRRAGVPTTLRASAAEMNSWAQDRLGVSGLQLIDHSGLGDQSTIKPQAMVALLSHERTRKLVRPLMRNWDLRDEKGRIDRAHPLKVGAKTGTLNFVSGLGGYVVTPEGRDLSFAIFAADTARRAEIPKSNREAPKGVRSYNRRSKIMQQALIERWSAIYSEI